MLKKIFGKRKLTFTKKILIYLSDEKKIDYLISQGIFYITVNVYYTNFYILYRMFENNQKQKLLNKVNIDLGQYLNYNRDNLKKLLELLTIPLKRDDENIEKDVEELKSTIETFIQTLED